MNFFNKKIPTIEFMCPEVYLNIIPKPTPSRKFLDDWYKKLPLKCPVSNSSKIMKETSTVKKCAPFLDSMTVGWIIPLMADVFISSNNDCSKVEWESNFPEDIISTHTFSQINGETKHPEFPKIPLKFLNLWHIKVPKGWSVLFTDPLNRPNSMFQCLDGIVDCDDYFYAVNFPFFWKKPNFKGILKAGTPLVQAIPFKRDNLKIKSNIRALTQKELLEIKQTELNHRTHNSFYRKFCWKKK